MRKQLNPTLLSAQGPVPSTVRSGPVSPTSLPLFLSLSLTHTHTHSLPFPLSSRFLSTHSGHAVPSSRRISMGEVTKARGTSCREERGVCAASGGEGGRKKRSRDGATRPACFRGFLRCCWQTPPFLFSCWPFSGGCLLAPSHLPSSGLLSLSARSARPLSSYSLSFYFAPLFLGPVGPVPSPSPSSY